MKQLKLNVQVKDGKLDFVYKLSTKKLLNTARRAEFNYRWRGFQIPVSLPWPEPGAVEGHPATKNSL